MTTRHRDGGGPPPERLVALFALRTTRLSSVVGSVMFASATATTPPLTSTRLAAFE